MAVNEGNRTIQLMGTTIQLWIQHLHPEPILDEAIQRLKDYEQRFSANAPSHLMTINQQAGKQPVKVEEDLLELIKIGKAHSLPQDSFLNIAIGPLTQAWHIGFQDAERPTDAQISEILKVIDPKKIVIDDQKQTIFLEEKMSIDLGALAKGYFADQLLAYFKSVEVPAALIDLGGNVLVYGDAPNREDGYWRVGIQHPALSRGNFLTALKIKNQSVVTSGIYERTNIFAGKTYHHIFNSQTGYPIETQIASLTIVSDKSLDGEIWTTRLFGHSMETILTTLDKLEGIHGLVVTKKGEVYYSKALANRIIQ